jgi:hypothetical protein
MRERCILKIECPALKEEYCVSTAFFSSARTADLRILQIDLGNAE